MSDLIIPQCKDCTMPDIMTGRCTVFVDPAYQHREGRKCWGKCDSIEDMIRRLEAIAAYNPQSRVARHELEEWKETQIAVS